MNAVVPTGKLARAGQALRRFVLGPADFPQKCLLGMSDPQSEVSVWLDSAGAPLEVTQNNIIVAARPLTIGIGLEKEYGPADVLGRHTVLRFKEMGGEQHLLGEIRLRMSGTIPLGNEQLCLFETRGSTNHCVPRGRLWLRYLDQEYRKWRSA